MGYQVCFVDVGMGLLGGDAAEVAAVWDPACAVRGGTQPTPACGSSGGAAALFQKPGAAMWDLLIPPCSEMAQEQRRSDGFQMAAVALTPAIPAPFPVWSSERKKNADTFKWLGMARGAVCSARRRELLSAPPCIAAAGTMSHYG